MARLAIITICYNDREGLSRTFASVFGQSCRDIEYIVVDGGSTDGSVDLIKANAARITTWTSEKDAGIYDAQNKGWYTANAPFVLFLNAGDVFASADVLERTIPMLTDAVDIVYGDAQLMDQRGCFAMKTHPQRITSAWLMKEVVAHQSQFIRRSLLEKVEGYDLRYPIAADYAFFAQLFWETHLRLRHAGFVISAFDTTGFSSAPEQKQRAAAERKAIQRAFAPQWWYFVYHGYAGFNRLIGR
ncbi:MAG: glycosyltransferase [Flavobacteriales bacterium]|nr:glycosyltransferase [Flavobacteriales bacterium]